MELTVCEYSRQIQSKYRNEKMEPQIVLSVITEGGEIE